MLENGVEIEISEPQQTVLKARASIIATIAGQGGGKTLTLGLLAAWKISNFPEAKGFIGANTEKQLSESTLSRVVWVFENVYGWTEYDPKTNPKGVYIIGKQPPRYADWKLPGYKFKSYNSIISFKNGAIVFLGSLENYKAHDGKEFAWAHLDETKDTKKEALTMVILARLRQYGLWYHKGTGKVIWAFKLTKEVAERQGFEAWTPAYIHTSPAEGNVEWLVELLNLQPYEKEIRQKVTQGSKDYFLRHTKPNVITCIYPTHFNADNLRAGFIEDRKSQLSESEYLKFICGYPFGRNGGEYFPHFSRAKFVGKYPYQKGTAICSTWDFNASPYVTCLLCQIRFEIKYYHKEQNLKYDKPTEGATQMNVVVFRFFKEYALKSPHNTTEHTAQAFGEDFAADKPDVFVDGDASGYSRIEGMGNLTQYEIVRRVLSRYFYLSSGWLRTKRTNVQNRKRRDIMNKIFDGRLPMVEIEIDESCTHLIKDCEYLLVAPDGGKFKEEEKDSNGIKVQKLGHLADAMEYLIIPTLMMGVVPKDLL